MNEILLHLGIESWKPLIGMLVLPPVPFILLILIGARLMFNRRLIAWLLILVGTGGIWFGSTAAVASGLYNWLLHPPPALTESQIADLKRAPKTAIVVLGGGRRLLAPEYGVSSLSVRSADRLRFGIWLSRETGLPLAFSGGVAHGARPGPTEAEIAARVAEREFGRPLRWTENESRDTRENAVKTVALLLPQGIEQIVLVTESFHMPRALANFQRAAEGRKLQIVPAPMNVPVPERMRVGDWLPTPASARETWFVFHEWLGRMAGA